MAHISFYISLYLHIFLQLAAAPSQYLSAHHNKRGCRLNFRRCDLLAHNFAECRGYPRPRKHQNKMSAIQKRLFCMARPEAKPMKRALRREKQPFAECPKVAQQPQIASWRFEAISAGRYAMGRTARRADVSTYK